jgi:hypothetical protein
MPTWQARLRRRTRARITDKRVWVLVAVGLAILTGYQVYALRLVHRNAHTAEQVRVLRPKVARLTKVQCANTRLYYELLNALAQDSTSSFGSPPDGKPIPGARHRLIERLYAAERSQLPILRRQGCKVSLPPLAEVP